MKTMLFTFGAVLALSGCAARGDATAWGKAGVSRLDFATDLGLCSGRAAQVDAGNGAYTAGGVSGSNSTPGTALPDNSRNQGDQSNSRPSTAVAQSSALPTSGGTYQGTASSDYAQRAAMQQRTQEMLRKRAQDEVFRRCITEKGYSEFELTPEQRAQLGALKQGSNEYLQYLHKLGSNPPASESARESEK